MGVSLTTYGTDRRLCLGAAEAIRAPIYYESWNTIRIGLQQVIDGPPTNISGTPRWVVGVCHGDTNVMVASSSDHVVAVRQSAPTLSYAAGPPKTYRPSSLYAFQAYKRVGTTDYNTPKTLDFYRYLSADTTVRRGLFVEINKTTKAFGVGWSVSTASTDLSDTEFKAIMELMSLTSISNVRSDYSYDTVTANFNIDEATDGALDHLFVYWDRSTHLFTFNLRHRKVA